MATKALDSAFPVFDSEGDATRLGLNKREYFAAMAMQGMLANKAVTDVCFKTGIAISSVEIADLLILHLNRTANKKSNSEEPTQKEDGVEA